MSNTTLAGTTPLDVTVIRRATLTCVELSRDVHLYLYTGDVKEDATEWRHDDQKFYMQLEVGLSTHDSCFEWFEIGEGESLLVR